MNPDGDRPTDHDCDTVGWPYVAWRLIGAVVFLAIVAMCLGWRPWQ